MFLCYGACRCHRCSSSNYNLTLAYQRGVVTIPLGFFRSKTLNSATKWLQLINLRSL